MAKDESQQGRRKVFELVQSCSSLSNNLGRHSGIKIQTAVIPPIKGVGVMMVKVAFAVGIALTLRRGTVGESGGGLVGTTGNSRRTNQAGIRA